MDRHVYLRAYMAGVVVPTVLLLLGFLAFLVLRFVCHVPTPIERILIFPLAIIPNAFGVWNMLYVALRSSWRVPIGLHGAALPLILAPLGIALATGLGFLRRTDSGVIWFDVLRIPTWSLALFPLFAIMAYYLIWKYLVGFLNRVQGIQ